jgi:PAS domain S-box-containing protein
VDSIGRSESYRIFGVSRETFVPSTENFLQLVHPDDRAIVLATRDQIRQGICPPAYEYRIIRPDGAVRQIYRENELIPDEAGEPLYFAGTIQDVTEQHNTERQLRQAQKMEAIGNLTGGMAHDFNNLLGVIIGNLDLTRERTGNDAELQELVGEALEAAWRGAELTRSLLAFSRRQPLRPAQIDPNELVANTVRLLGRMLGEDIEISLSLAEDIWPVIADPAQLEASLANLSTNARDAMPRGGRLIITTANRHLDADYAATHTDVIPGDFAMIEVSDTGIGMSAETTSQIFEPFFTTKEPGKGTGLGLSMVFGFLRQSGGHVNVYSEPGVGTTFRLYLPRAMTEALPGEVTDARPVVGAAGETVLVVEDNPAMRRVVLRQLRDLGYRVLECDRAAAGFELLQREPVDLLLTDIVMPGGLDGVELARLALERWPALKVVLTSGFSEARINGNGEFLGSLQLLSKPYSKEELAAVLRAALGG